jgi:hypothetical protein
LCQQERVEKRMGYDAARACVSGAITRNETTGTIAFEAYQVRPGGAFDQNGPPCERVAAGGG